MRFTMGRIVALGLGAILALGVMLFVLLYHGLNSVQAPLDNLARLSATSSGQLAAQVLAVRDANLRAMGLVVWLIVLFIGIATGIIFFVVRMVTRPVKMLKDAAEAIRRGEFGHRIEEQGPGELGHLAEDINRIVRQLEAASVTSGDLQRMTDRLQQEAAERRKAEEDHRKLQAEAQKSAGDWLHTFDALQFPIFILDLGGAAIQANRAASEVSGFSLQEMYGRPIASLGSSGLWSTAGRLAASIRETRAATSAEARDEPTGRTWEVTADLFTEPGIDEPRILMVAREITQMLKLQESLRRDATMSAMGSLVAGVAHEVRNPIFGISSTLDAMEARLGARAEYKSYVRNLRTELERLSRLMKGLLEYGRPFETRLSPHPVAPVIEQAISSCRAQAQAAAVEIGFDAPDALPTVRMDLDRLPTAFRNLLENAIQHTPPGGRVSVKALERAGPAGASVLCAVEDTGAGFPAEALGRVFEPFFTLRVGGTGLGLAIAQRIVEEHGGEISAGNRPEGGGVVIVRLPAAPGGADTGDRTSELQDIGSR